MRRLLKKFYGRKKNAVAVDVGVSSIKIVAINSVSGVPTIDIIYKLPTPDTVISDGLDVEALSAGLKKAVQDCGLENRKVISTVWADKVITRHIKVPFMPAKDLENAVRWEAEKFIPVPVKDLNIHYIPLGTGIETGAETGGEGVKYQHLLLVAVYTDIVYKYYNAFELAGLHLEILDLQCLALWCLFNNDTGLAPVGVSKTSNIFAVADIGTSAVHIVFIKKGLMKYTRSFPVGSGPLCQGENNISPAGIENLINELRLSLNYYQSQEEQFPVEKLFLTGGISKSGLLPRVLSQELDLPVETAVIKVGSRDIEPDFALALGLALRRMLNNV